MSKSFLITGGLGVIGSQLANSLRGKITIISRSLKYINRIKDSNIRVLVKPINKIALKDLEDIDVIYHCASTVHNFHVLTDPYLDVQTNIEGTIHILELCKKMKKKPKVVFLSTFFVYGREFDKTQKQINEESQTNPLSLYPITKLAAEQIIKLYSRLYKIPYVICRLTNVYSEYENFNDSRKGAFNYLIMRALKGQDLQLYNGGNFYRDYIHLDDVVLALKTVLKKSNDTFLIAYGKSYKFKTLIDYVLDMTGNKSKVKKIIPSYFHKSVGIENFFANTSKICSIGWKPRITPKQGIARVIKKYQQICQSNH